MTVPRPSAGGRAGTLYVGPDRWALGDTSPATLAEWRARLGGGMGARMAVQGAVNRGRLHRTPSGRWALATGQLTLL